MRLEMNSRTALRTRFLTYRGRDRGWKCRPNMCQLWFPLLRRTTHGFTNTDNFAARGLLVM